MAAPLPERIGRYRVLGLVGQGAMGVVYKAVDDSLEREVALKVMSVAHVGDAESRARFVREGRAAGRLQHPNIVVIYELGEFEGAPFMAMEFLEGMDLQQAITRGLRPNPRATLPIVQQVLSGLGHAHDHGIVHRDIKPSNVFLPRGRPAKIMDFGVARLGGGATTAGTIVGTPHYMSPEQVQGAAVDGRSDLFSTGLILYELVTGERAYQGDNVVTLLFQIAQGPPDLSLIPRTGAMAGLHAVLARALAHAPADRYPDAHAMEADVAAVLAELGGAVDGAAASDRALLFRADRLGSAPMPSAERPAAASVPPAPPPAPDPGVVTPAGGQRSTVHRPRSAPAAPPRREPVAAALGMVLAALVLGGYGLFRLLRPAAPPVAPAPAATPAPPASVPAPASPTRAPVRPAAGPSAAAAAPPAAAPPSAAPAVPLLGGEGTALPLTPRPPREAEPATAAGPGRLDRANELLTQGRYAAAMAEARAVLRREPGNAEAQAVLEDAEAAQAVENHLQAAREAVKRGDQAAALEHVRAGLAVAPSDSRLLALFRQLNQ